MTPGPLYHLHGAAAGGFCRDTWLGFAAFVRVSLEPGIALPRSLAVRPDRDQAQLCLQRTMHPEAEGSSVPVALGDACPLVWTGCVSPVSAG